MSSFEELKQKGNTYYQSGDFQSACVYYKQAISNDSTNPIGYSNYAMALIKLQKYKEALEQCDIGLGYSPSDKIKTKLVWRKNTALENLPQETASTKNKLVDVPVVEVDELPIEYQ